MLSELYCENNCHRALRSLDTSMVILIAILHALPIFAFAWRCSTKTGLWGVAAMSAVIAVFTGNPAYLYAHLLAIGPALGICLVIMKKKRLAHRMVPLPVANPPPHPTRAGQWIGALPLSAVVAFIFLQNSGDQSSSPVAPSRQISNPPINAAHDFVSGPIQTTPIGVSPQRPLSYEQKKPVAHVVKTAKQCLKIVVEIEMVKCLEEAK